jgi:hypothetical protein
MTAQWCADSERNLRKAVGLTFKPIEANYQLGLLLTRMGKKEEAQLRLLDPGR